MKIKTSCALALLLTGAAIALPSPSVSKQRTYNAKRALAKLPHHGQPQPVQRTPGHRKAVSSSASTGGREYNVNWGGIVAKNNPENAVTQVQATFTIPNVQLASNDAPDGNYSGAAWVGIDGDDGCSQGGGWFSAGAYWYYQDSVWNYVPYYLWDDWVFPDLEISPGDALSVMVYVNYPGVNGSGADRGQWSFNNDSTGKNASGTLSNQTPLCDHTAEWIVENTNPSGVEMPDFGTIQFTDALYSASLELIGVSRGTEAVIVDDGVAYTDCSTSGQFQFTCTWTDTPIE